MAAKSAVTETSKTFLMSIRNISSHNPHMSQLKRIGVYTQIDPRTPLMLAHPTGAQ